MKLRFTAAILFIGIAWQVLAQIPDSAYTGVDTTLASYRLGRKIGEWLPVTILLGLAILYISKAYRHGGGPPKRLD